VKNVNILYNVNLPGSERIEYVIEFLNTHPLRPSKLCFVTNSKENSSVNIGYGIPNLEYLIERDNHFLISNVNDFSCLQLVNIETKKKNLSVLKGDNINPHKNDFLGFDIIENIFFHISRMEEVFADPEQSNNSCWLDESLHLIIKEGCEKQPIVDDLVLFFFEKILDTKVHQNTQYEITHDIDFLYRFKPLHEFIRSIIATIIYARGFSTLVNIIKHRYGMLKSDKIKDPYDTYSDLFLEDETKWERKLCFLMTGGNTKYDNRYSINHPYIKNVLSISKARNYTIGIHPSYNAHTNKKMYAKEKNKLENIIGYTVENNRQHILRYDWSITPYIYNEEGIQTDSSMGYKEHLGFRCGTGFPYHMYDFKNEEKFSWKEYPIAYMDSSANHESVKKNISVEKLTDTFMKTNQYNTYISFNFHNSSFDPLTAQGRALYKLYTTKIKSISFEEK